MIAVTNQEEAFAKVTPVSAVEEINGEYYVDSAASVTFTEMERSIDRLRKILCCGRRRYTVYLGKQRYKSYIQRCLFIYLC